MTPQAVETVYVCYASRSCLQNNASKNSASTLSCTGLSKEAMHPCFARPLRRVRLQGKPGSILTLINFRVSALGRIRLGLR